MLKNPPAVTGAERPALTSETQGRNPPDSETKSDREGSSTILTTESRETQGAVGFLALGPALRIGDLTASTIRVKATHSVAESILPSPTPRQSRSLGSDSTRFSPIVPFLG